MATSSSASCQLIAIRDLGPGLAHDATRTFRSRTCVHLRRSNNSSWFWSHGHIKLGHQMEHGLYTHTSSVLQEESTNADV